MEKITMKKFKAYCVDGDDTCYTVHYPAKNAKDCTQSIETCYGMEVLKVVDITNETPISADAVAHALKLQLFGQAEIDLIIRTLYRTGIVD